MALHYVNPSLVPNGEKTTRECTVVRAATLSSAPQKISSALKWAWAARCSRELARARAHTHACMHTCMHAHMRACMHVHMHACVHACMRTCSSSTRGNPHCTSTQVRDVAFASISIWFCQSRSIFCLSQVKCRFIFYLSCPCIFQPVLSP